MSNPGTVFVYIIQPVLKEICSRVDTAGSFIVTIPGNHINASQ